MNIILVHNSYREPGGEDTIFKQECQLLQDAGHKIIVYRRSNLEIKSYSRIERLALVRRIHSSGQTKQDFGQLLAVVRPDLVHVHNFFMMVSPSIYLACRDMSVPVVQTLHNYRLLCPAAIFFRDGKICEECPSHGLWRSVVHSCYRNSLPQTALVAMMVSTSHRRNIWTSMVDRYVALTEFARTKFINGGLPPERISVKPNFLVKDPGVRVGPGEYAVYVGRLSTEKGLHTLLSAWKRLKTAIPLHIVGDGPQGESLRAEATQRGIVGLVFRGRLSHEHTLETIKRASFLIFPSECYENFPATVAEAFACGVPVIASRLGAMEEIIRHGNTGLLFQAGNDKELSTHVEWACTHEQEMKAMGYRSRVEYQEKYTAELNYKMLIAIYGRVLADRRAEQQSQCNI
jgi:glycosyltransferase involved in cell wall biosynthesis